MTVEQAKELTTFIKHFSHAKELYTIQTEPLTLMPYTYGKVINAFIKFCYTNQLIVPDYREIAEEIKIQNANKEWLETLSLHQLLQSLSFFVRRDRFVDGLLASAIEDGTMINILTQIKKQFQF